MGECHPFVLSTHTLRLRLRAYFSIWHFLRLAQNQQRILPLLRRRLQHRWTRHVYNFRNEKCYISMSTECVLLVSEHHQQSPLSASQEWELLSKITTAFVRAVPSECDRLATNVFVLTMRAFRRIKLVHDGIFLSVRFFSVFTVLSMLLLWLCQPEYLSYMFKIRIKWQLILKGAFLSAFRFSIE